ncbi:hypothetical protein COV93_08895 [Candidatus Woesearchaeota archaeon CG11_big_fil_rev_8_21_14_0_20_43_8]|nr:MAG: hypothetical protein COV93_08895 [Candidatus Woesearchaeota archaeon CG11_big_fil_rev_8_21_14_0_20_43_8]PIO06381.1 MAG: hypothetical protein COT47_03420 [Candidatus Woesearchaeota archaeon CG08_land_8_20_14_0_20_43_7]
MVNGIQLTKNQARLMKYFTANIGRQFTINGIAKTLDMNVSLVHRSTTALLKEHRLIRLTKENHLTIDYFHNHEVLAYIEYLRREECLNTHKAITEFREEVRSKLKHEYFIMILFGSTVNKSNPRDYDILFIFEDDEKVRKREKALGQMAHNCGGKFDINVVAVDSIYEMAAKRSQKNILNESLNKHIILHGAEEFYRLLKDARQ